MSGKQLSEKAIEVICFIEQMFWTNGAIPTQEVISERLGVAKPTLKKYFEDEKFRSALLARGVELNEGKNPGLLNVYQLTLANSLLNLHDKRSVREKLKELGITSQQYNSWCRDPAFRDYLTRRAEDLFQGRDHEVYTALLNNAVGGDGKAIQLFFEMRGIYNPKLQVEVNLDQILVQVIEIIARHVTDPGILAAIADDMERLDTGSARRGAQAMPAIEAHSSIPEVATKETVHQSISF